MRSYFFHEKIYSKRKRQKIGSRSRNKAKINVCTITFNVLNAFERRVLELYPFVQFFYSLCSLGCYSALAPSASRCGVCAPVAGIEPRSQTGALNHSKSLDDDVLTSWKQSVYTSYQQSTLTAQVTFLVRSLEFRKEGLSKQHRKPRHK